MSVSNTGRRPGNDPLPDCNTCYYGFLGGKYCMDGYEPYTCDRYKPGYMCMGRRYWNRLPAKVGYVLVDLCVECGYDCFRMGVLAGRYSVEEIGHLLTLEDRKFLGLK